MGSMRAATVRLIGAVILLSLFAAPPSSASGSSVRREGSCSGRGDWRLRVSRESATTIKVRFDIEHVAPGDSWQLFLSDDGRGIFARTKVADADGELRAVSITRDRAGTDRVKGSGVNVTAGGSCDGVVRY
jgi:hypothetical protein